MEDDEREHEDNDHHAECFDPAGSWWWCCIAGRSFTIRGHMVSLHTSALAQEAGRRFREDQWIERILQPAGVRDNTIDSAPVEFIALPLKSPCVVLVLTVQAVSPDTTTLTGVRTALTA